MDLWKLAFFWGGICGLCVTTATAAKDDNTFAHRQKNHRPKTLRTDRMRKVSQWSNSEESMRYFKYTLLRPILIEREVDTVGNRIVQEHIKTFMSSYGWTITEDSFRDETPHGYKNFNTIIATQNPTAPRKLVLACHHDSKIFKDFKFVAATDSAVPCAMMLDMARLFNTTFWDAQKNKENDVTLEFWFLDGEEAFDRWTDDDSTYGARHLAYELEDRLDLVGREEVVPAIQRVDVMILLDLIGTSTTKFRSFFTETEKLYERMQKIEEKLKKENLLEGHSPNYFSSAVGRAGGIQDDHIPFLNKGVPILHLISHPFPKEWHKETDNESALDFDTINNINKILRVFVAEYLHMSP